LHRSLSLIRKGLTTARWEHTSPFTATTSGRPCRRTTDGSPNPDRRILYGFVVVAVAAAVRGADIVPGSEASASGLAHYLIARQSSVALQAPHCVQWMKRPCTWSSSACSKTVPQFPQRKSIVCELAMRMGGAFTTFSMPLASTTLNVRCGFSMIAPFECSRAHSRLWKRPRTSES
jgi:hypothetical protein